MLRAKTGEGNFLPFMPADRLDAAVKLKMKKAGWFQEMYFAISGQYYFPQNRPAQFESSTSDYGLLNAGLGNTMHLTNGHIIQIDLACNNILNKVYYDHLSRFKEFRIYNMGRNITLNFKYQFQ